MKKILSLFLCLTLLFSLISCSSSLEQEETEGNTATAEETLSATEESTETVEEEDDSPIVYPEGFSVGFARMEVNPDVGTGLGGYGDHMNRLSKTILDDLMLTCTAVCDGENVLLIFSTDLVGIGPSIVNMVQTIIEREYGIPPENVILNATHSHSSPAMYTTNVTGMAKYAKKYYAAAEKIAGQALRDLKSAEIYIGRSETDGLSYVRRYVNKIDGTYLGKNLSPNQDPNVVAHETEADEEMQVIRFDRSEGKDVVLVNWQCHPTGPGGEGVTDVSADWVGSLRDTAEAENDVLVSFHQGAAGNIAQAGYVAGENINSDYIQHGKDIAKSVTAALQNMEKVEAGKIQSKKVVYAAEYSEAIQNGTAERSYSSTIDLYAISVGDIAFSTIPGELHDTLGVELKTKSPFKMTFVCGYSNGLNGYLPAEFAFENGGYEVSKTQYAIGTGEALVSTLLTELNTLYTTK